MQQPQPAFSPQLSWQTTIDAFLWSRKIKSLSNRTLEYYALVLKQFCEAENIQSNAGVI
jgi:hypothetical protein